MMRDILKYGVVLMVIASAASGLLSLVYEATEERRLSIIEEERRRALGEVLPAAAVFDEKDGIFTGYDSEKKENIVGYAAIARAPGYSDVIETMVGIGADWRISGIKILSQQETPGLGARVEEFPPSRTLAGILMGKDEPDRGPRRPWFQEQFSGRGIDELCRDRLDGITGATITTDAVIDSVRESAMKLKGRKGGNR